MPRSAIVGTRSWGRLALPAVVFVAIVYAVPLAALLVKSGTDPALGWENYARLLGHVGYLATIGRTLLVAAAAALCCLVLGYPVAYAIASASPRTRRLLLAGVIAPYLTSVLVRTFAWQVLLGRVGPLSELSESLGLGRHELLFTSGAVVLGLTHYLLPLMVLPILSVMRQVDPSLLRAAASLGATPLRAFVRAYLPPTLPGVQVGLVLTFVYGVGAFATPAILGGDEGQLLGVLIHSSIEQQADLGFAAAASVLLAIAVLLVIAAYRWLAGGRLESLAAPRDVGASATAGGRRPRSSEGVLLRGLEVIATAVDRTGLSRRRWPLTAYAGLVCLFLALPQLVAVPISFSSVRTLVLPPPGWSTRWYSEFLTTDWLVPLGTSLQVAIPAALTATALGTLAALAVTRGLGPRASTATTTLLLLPLIFPTVTAAAAYFSAWLPLGLTDTAVGLWLAHTALVVPFAFAVMLAGARTLDQRYERAAASLGADRRRQLTRVVLPLLSGGILTSLFFTFLTSFDEAVVSIFLSGLNVKTLPRRMYEALTLESDPRIAVVAVVSMLIALLAFAISALVGRRTKRSSTNSGSTDDG